MDLDQLEAFALSDDRGPALAALVPGSEDHDYWRAIELQHRGQLAEVDALIATWPDRHGDNARYHRLRLRQRLLAASGDLDRHADALIAELGLSHQHQPDLEEAAARFPTTLDPELVDADRLVAEALARSRSTDELTAAGLPRLLGLALDAHVRRRLLERLDRTGLPGLIAAIAADLGERSSSGFGSLAIHQRLTAAELDELATLRPTLRIEPRWVAARLARLRPADHIDWTDDLGARVGYLDALIAATSSLPIVFAPLRALLHGHRLACDVRLGTFDRGRLRAYLGLPRTGASAASAIARRYANITVEPVDYQLQHALGLPLIGDDSELVRSYVHALLADDDCGDLDDVLDLGWLTQARAEVRLLAGSTDPQWAKLYGAAATAALRDRVDLEFAPTNPVRWDRTGPVTLALRVKNVPTLRVRVFRINVPAWFDATRKDVDVSIDLDGLAAGWEQTLEFAHAPIRRHDVQLDLSACAAPGTYVVELIGAGRASRAILRRGDLRLVSRPVAAGLAVEILDERGQRCPKAWLRLDGLTLSAGANGVIAVPFSTQPQTTAVLVGDGDVAVAAALTTRGEQYELAMTWLLDRQALVPETTARAVVRLALTVGGVAASLALLEEPYLELVTIDRRQVEVKQRQPLVVADDVDPVIEFVVPAHLDTVTMAVGGRVRSLSTQRTLDLRSERSIEVATIHRGTATAAFHLRPTGAGWRLALLGKTGEPRPGRAVALRLRAAVVTWELEATLATDAHGEVILGPLPGIVAITATAGEVTQTFPLTPLAPATTSRLVARAGEDVVVPIAIDADHGSPAPEAWSLVEERAEVPYRDAAGSVVAEVGRLIARGLPPGRYRASGPGIATEIIVVPAEAPVSGAWAALPGAVLELSARRPTTAAVRVDGEGGLRIAIADGSAQTRVHVLATGFAATPAVPDATVIAPRAPTTFAGALARAVYVSGRDIGDEYRYVLDRQRQPRRAGSLLDKPSLLLNPWALRATSTATQHARVGSAYASAPAPARAGTMGGFGGYARADQAATSADPAFAGHDFLAAPALLWANLTPDDDGAIHLAPDQLATAAQLQIVVCDPSATTTHHLGRDAAAVAVRDRRLAAALDGDRHFREDRRLASAPAGGAIAIVDRATARVELVDTVEKLYRALCAISGDATLARWDFIPRWHTLSEAERMTLYSRHACHELALFIYGKDRPLFERALRPYLRDKLHPTFIDRWLVGDDLRDYLEPWRRDRLNALELALLAQRHPEVGPTLHRRLADAVDLIVPDPAADDRLVDTFVAGGKASGGPSMLEGAAEAEMDMAMMAQPVVSAPPGMPPAAPKTRESSKKRSARRERAVDDEADELVMREQAPMLFRAADRTQEWAEHNWYERRVETVGPDLIGAARLWRDLADHRAGRFLSPHVVDAAASLPAAMAALAFIDLPFVAAPHAIVASGAGATITTGSDALAALVELAAVTTEPTATALCGQSYFRADDRWTWDGAEQVEKYVTDELLTAVVYACQIVVTNPTSRTLRVAVLHQIPAGALPVAGAVETATTRCDLAPYQSQTIEYAFYFAQPGAFTHYGAQVAEAGGTAPAILAAIAPRVLRVVDVPTTVDATSWPHLSQRGSLDEVCQFLASHNLGRIDLDAIAWRCHDRDAFVRITDALTARSRFDATLWSYALVHRDHARTAQWLAALGRGLGDVGPTFSCALVTRHPVEEASYQHLEYAPLINARAHRLGDRRVVPNAGLAAQWQAFLDHTAHRAQPRAEDWLAAAHYLFAMDRDDAAAAALDRVSVKPDDAVALQRDYLRGYRAIGAGDLATAGALAQAHRDHPVDRWRARFAALAALVGDATQAATTTAIDPDSREQALAAATAAQPTIAVRMDGDAIVLDHAQVTTASLRFYRMDLELLFSRQPFFGASGDRFAFIEPGRTDTITLPERGPTRVELPAELARHSVVIEVVAGTARATVSHFAHQLAVTVTAPYGRLQVRDATTGAARAAAYVKAFARLRGGAVQFYKDGYTDLCGRFDYATISTDELDRVERFALLVVDDHAGATVVEAAPPPR